MTVGFNPTLIPKQQTNKKPCILVYKTTDWIFFYCSQADWCSSSLNLFIVEISNVHFRQRTMNQIFVAVLVLTVLVAAVEGKRHKKCLGKTPGLDDCRRNDQLWRYNGYHCERMKDGCYKKITDKHNAFETLKKCRKRCESVSG